MLLLPPWCCCSDLVVLLLMCLLCCSVSSVKKQWAGFHAFGYAALSGTLGAQNVLFAKSVGEMMKTSFQVLQCALRWGAAVYTVGACTCCFMRYCGVVCCGVLHLLLCALQQHYLLLVVSCSVVLLQCTSTSM